MEGKKVTQSWLTAVCMQTVWQKPWEVTLHTPEAWRIQTADRGTALSFPARLVCPAVSELQDGPREVPQFPSITRAPLVLTAHAVTWQYTLKYQSVFAEFLNPVILTAKMLPELPHCEIIGSSVCTTTARGKGCFWGTMLSKPVKLAWLRCHMQANKSSNGELH